MFPAIEWTLLMIFTSGAAVNIDNLRSEKICINMAAQAKSALKHDTDHRFVWACLPHIEGEVIEE